MTRCSQQPGPWSDCWTDCWTVVLTVGPGEPHIGHMQCETVWEPLIEPPFD